MGPLKREQARRERESGLRDVNSLQTFFVERGRKSRPWINSCFTDNVMLWSLYFTQYHPTMPTIF